jgi:hypothetical protein
MKKITAKFEMELEQCPFCAEEDNLVIGKERGFYRIACHNCNTIGPNWDLPNEAIDAWNHRPANKEEHLQYVKKEAA